MAVIQKRCFLFTLVVFGLFMWILSRFLYGYGYGYKPLTAENTLSGHLRITDDGKFTQDYDPGTAAWDQFARFKHVFPNYTQQLSPHPFTGRMIKLRHNRNWAELRNQDISNPYISNQDISNPYITNPYITNPYITNQDISNPYITNQDISRSVFGLGRAGVCLDSDVQECVWTLRA